MKRVSVYHRVLVTVAASLMTAVPAFSQAPKSIAEDTIWQPKRHFPPLVIAKHDVKDASHISVLLPETIYEQLMVNFTSKKTEGQINTINDLREYFGPLERTTIPLAELKFETIDGATIPQEQAIKRLANPQHVFYGMGPDKYHAQVVRPETIVLKPSTEKPLPRSKRTFPETD